MKKLLLTSVLFTSFFLGGCDDNTQTKQISGTVIDGEIAYAKVCSDVNFNNSCDAGEPTTESDAMGNYNLTVQSKDKILVEGTDRSYDIRTSKLHPDLFFKTDIALTDKSNKVNISPFTTYITAVMQKDNTDPVTIMNELKQTLKIEQDVDLLGNFANNPELLNIAQILTATITQVNIDVANTIANNNLSQEEQDQLLNTAIASTLQITQQVIDTANIDIQSVDGSNIDSLITLALANLSGLPASNIPTDFIKNIDGDIADVVTDITNIGNQFNN